MEKYKLKLTIGGLDYYITTDEEAEYMKRISSELERAIDDCKYNNPHLSLTMSSVMTALNYCYQLKKANESADNLRVQMKEYIQETARARQELESVQRENEKMKREIQSLRLRISELDVQPDSPVKAYASGKRVNDSVPSKKSKTLVSDKSQKETEKTVPLEDIVTAPEELLSFFDVQFGNSDE